MNEIRRDIDLTVLECAFYRDFKIIMHNKGYKFDEINGESVIYHPYCEEPIYIKSLGNQYHKEQIKERLTTKIIPFQNWNRINIIINVKITIVNLNKRNSQNLQECMQHIQFL